MNDLISRQAAIDALEREKTYCTAYKEGYTKTDVFQKYNMGLTDGIKALNKLPSAQSEKCEDCGNFNKTMLLIPQSERKHGKWIEHGEPNEHGKYELWYYSCSVCHHVGGGTDRYCAFCGAKMDGGKDNE